MLWRHRIQLNADVWPVAVRQAPERCAAQKHPSRRLSAALRDGACNGSKAPRVAGDGSERLVLLCELPDHLFRKRTLSLDLRRHARSNRLGEHPHKLFCAALERLLHALHARRGLLRGVCGPFEGLALLLQPPRRVCQLAACDVGVLCDENRLVARVLPRQRTRRARQRPAREAVRVKILSRMHLTLPRRR